MGWRSRTDPPILAGDLGLTRDTTLYYVLGTAFLSERTAKLVLQNI
jgi:hypothetical protein